MPVTLEQVRYERNPYPVDQLDGAHTALLLFAGGFRGRNDGIWFADHGIAATCVDVEPSGLDEMEQVYPASWRFVCADAFPFCERAVQTGHQWDVISVDCPTGLFDWCAASAPLWCAVARGAVILGTGPDTPIAVPTGWELGERMYRSDLNGGVFWQVLIPEMPA